jgi:non-homologous end joining protein Ku
MAIAPIDKGLIGTRLRYAYEIQDAHDAMDRLRQSVQRGGSKAPADAPAENTRRAKARSRGA